MARKSTGSKVVRRKKSNLPEINTVVEMGSSVSTPPPAKYMGLTWLVGLIAIFLIGGFLLRDKVGCQMAQRNLTVDLVKEIPMDALDGESYQITAICALGDDRVAFTDAQKTKIGILGLDGSVKAVFGKRGRSKGDLRHLSGISSDGDGNLFVLDHETADIFGFRSDGSKFIQVDSSGTGYFYGPRGLCYLKGNFAVADTGSCRVVIMDPVGQTVVKWGKRGTKQDEFGAPNGVAALSKGGLVVSDYENKRLSIWDEKGGFKTMVNLSERPVAIAVDAKDRVFVALDNNTFVRVYRTDNGRYLGELKTSNTQLDASYRNVSALCVVGGDKLVAANTNRMWVYKLK
jgi:hypothetical protein